MRHYGIIGNPVAQSFSAKYFTEFFAREGIDAEYTRYCCPTIAHAQDILPTLDGCNVTIPHKQVIIPLLDQLDETAREIGAVNVVKREADGRRTGYNTDAIGFMDSIRPLLRENDQWALVLGTGGAAKAVYYGLRKLGLQPTYVSRTPQEGMLGYDQLSEEVMQRYTVIVNCTPLGMWPDTDAAAPLPYALIGKQHLLFDCIYNPEQTLFLKRGHENGATTMNGIEMLYGQAKAAWQIWNHE